VQKTKIFFYSEGLKLAGLLHIPDDLGNGKAPTIVFSHGYTGSKEGQVARHAKPFVDAGYVCLTFDHRGFGESQGPEGRLIARERIEDVKNAITFATQQPEVDRDKIGLFGLSFGAAVVLYAALDPRVKCVVSISAIANGERWLRSLRRYWEWTDFVRQLEEDRVSRVMTGQSRCVDATEIVVPPPDVLEHYAERRGRGRPGEWNRPLESADSILALKPEDIVDQLSPTAVLFCHGANDHLTALEDAQLLYEKAREPKRLFVIQDASHVEMYESPYFERTAQVTLKFADEYLR
jgi:hypothetical protein